MILQWKTEQEENSRNFTVERSTDDKTFTALGIVPAAGNSQKGADDPAGQVVLDYCAAVRGILNDDQGGPLEPPGLRMAEALAEVRQSLQRNLDLNKPGPAHKQLERLAGCIDKGLEAV